MVKLLLYIPVEIADENDSPLEASMKFNPSFFLFISNASVESDYPLV